MASSGAVRAANLKEIKILREVLNIEGHGRGVRLAEPPSPKCPRYVCDALRKKITNTAFLGKMITELRTPAKDETRCFYWGVPRPVAIDLFLARMALLGHRILVNDPILEITGFCEDSPDSPREHPWKWVKYTVENALFVVSLEEWIKAGIVWLVPPVAVWNREAWWELAELAQKVLPADDPQFRSILSYDVLGALTESLLESLQIATDRGGSAALRKELNIKSPEEERKFLQAMSRIPEEELPKFIARSVQTQLHLPDEAVGEYLALKARQVFGFPVTEQMAIIEKYPGEGPRGTRYSFMGMQHGAAPHHMVYLAEEFDCIPTSDREVDRRMLQLWARKMGLTGALQSDVERTHATTGISLELLNDVPLDFVLSVREKGYATRLRAHLESGWDAIRSARSADDFGEAFRAFDTTVRTAYEEFQAEWADVRWEAIRQFGAAGISGLGSLAGAVVSAQSLLVAGTGLAGVFGGLATSRLRELRKLRRNPLFVFLRLQQGKRSV